MMAIHSGPHTKSVCRHALHGSLARGADSRLIMLTVGGTLILFQISHGNITKCTIKSEHFGWCSCIKKLFSSPG